MSVKIRVNVTQKDITNGEKASRICCPVVLAMKRAIRNNSVKVSYSFATFIKNKHEYVTVFPTQTITFIHAFDDNEAVQPFKFECEANV